MGELRCPPVVARAQRTPVATTRARRMTRPAAGFRGRDVGRSAPAPPPPAPRARTSPVDEGQVATDVGDTPAIVLALSVPEEKAAAMPAARGPRRGARQRKALAAPADDPETLSRITIRLPDRLRHKAHEAAAALNISLNEYVIQLLEQAPMPEAAQDQLPLAETA